MKKIVVSTLVACAMAFAADKVPSQQWSFDEGTGTNLADKSGAVGTTRTGWGPGRLGKALVLNGSNTQYATMAFPTAIQPGKSSFSFAFWIQPTTYDIASKQKQRRIFGFDRWPFYFTVGDLQGDGKVNFYNGFRADTNSPALSAGCSSTTNVPLHQWTHVAMVCDREEGKLKVYLNGALNNSSTLPKDFLEKADIKGDRALTVGSSWQSFAGSVDELRYARKALTADEIKALASGK